VNAEGQGRGRRWELAHHGLVVGVTHIVERLHCVAQCHALQLLLQRQADGLMQLARGVFRSARRHKPQGIHNILRS
jgi:hypothetical protein